MTTDTDAAPAADAQPQAEPKTTELQSKDTGVLSAIKAQAETATPPPKVDKPEADKPASHANPADKGTSDADSAADHQDDDDQSDKIDDVVHDGFLDGFRFAFPTGSGPSGS